MTNTNNYKATFTLTQGDGGHVDVTIEFDPNLKPDHPEDQVPPAYALAQEIYEAYLAPMATGPIEILEEDTGTSRTLN